MDLDVRRLEVGSAVRKNPPDSAKFEVSGSAALGLEQAQVLHRLGAEQRVLGRRVGEPRGRVVLETLTHGQLVHLRQADELEVGGRADSAQEQDLRALVGAAR